MATNAKKLTYGSSTPILVDYATSDSLGNNIGDTYATKSALTGKLDNNANAIITTLGNNAVNKANKAVQDENGNNIASTYQKTAFIINGEVAATGNITFTDLVVSDLLNAITNKQRIVFIPSAKAYPAIDLNAQVNDQALDDNEYTLNGSCAINNDTNITIYSGVINVNATTATGTYKVGLVNSGGAQTPKIAIDASNLLESGTISNTKPVTILKNTGWVVAEGRFDTKSLQVDNNLWLSGNATFMMICTKGTRLYFGGTTYSYYNVYGLK